MWGRNSEGQCATDDKPNYFSPRQLDLERVASVDLGDLHSAFIMEADGALLACGDNSKGQCGVEGALFVHQPVVVFSKEPLKQVACGYRHTLLLTRSGVVWGFGSRRNYELGDTNHQSCFVRITDRVVKVSAGSFSAALTEDQRVLLWGTGEFG